MKRSLLLLCVLSVLSLATANPLLTAASILAFAAMIALVWRSGEPPVLAFALSYQWLQVSVKIFHADFSRVPVETMFPAPTGDRALWLSLSGLVALAFGMRVGMFRMQTREGAEARSEVLGLSIPRLFRAYVTFFFLGVFGHTAALGAGGFAQVLLALLNLKWFFFFLLAYAVIARRSHASLLALAVAAEVIVGFTGFFSGFKEVFFVFLIAFFSARPRFSKASLVIAGAATGVLLVLGSAWMIVREDYRAYISGGELAQVVHVGFADRADYMWNRVAGLDREQIARGFERLSERLEYVNFFAQVMFTVPRLIPYEDGELWKQAIEHVLKPRILFPDKPVLPSDSELTMKYVVSWLASDAEGSSISMGYFAESYIDFGPVGMMLPIFGVGLAWGLIYRYLLGYRTLVVYTFAAAVAVLINANQFEIHNVKLVGGVLMGFLVTAGWVRWGIPAMSPWFRGARRSRAAHPQIARPRPANP